MMASKLLSSCLDPFIPSGHELFLLGLKSAFSYVPLKDRARLGVILVI